MDAALPRATDWDDPDPFESLIGWAPALVLVLLLAPLSWVAGFALLGRARISGGVLLLAASAAGFALYYLVLAEAGWEPPRNGLF